MLVHVHTACSYGSSIVLYLPAVLCLYVRPARDHVIEWRHDAHVVDMAIRPEQHQRVRQAYLWLVACMYMFAFGSLYTQVPGEPCAAPATSCVGLANDPYHR